MSWIRTFRGRFVGLLFGAYGVAAGFGLSACSHSAVMIRETPMGLSEIRRVITTVTGDPRTVSENGYELTSNYFDRKDKPIDRPGEVRERISLTITILGDRRPYDIAIQSKVEVRTPDGYEDLGEDEEISQAWADKIRRALHESRDKRNFIDDFKAF